MPQHRQDPPLDHQRSGFDLGLVPGLVGTGRQNADAVMQGHFLISGVEVGFLTASAADASLRVIGNDQLRNSAQKFKGTDVGGKPIF